LPLAPLVTVSQPSLLLAVHAQPVAAVTVRVPDPPPATAFAEAGAIVGAQGAPAWVTVNVLPPIVTVPVRAVVVGLAAMLYVTEPLPLPDPPEIVIHAALLVDVHAQPVAAVTVTVPLFAEDATFTDPGAIVGSHGAPAWLTVKVLLPMVSLPVRGVVVGFAATS
jgi:hypothetical protein